MGAVRKTEQYTYQEPARRRQGRPQIQVVERSGKIQPKKQQFAGQHPAKVVLTCAFLAVVASLSLCCKAALTEVTTQISSQQKELSRLESENIRLNMELEGMVSLKNIEEYATNELGLSKLEKYQVTYLELDDDERVTVTEDAQNVGVQEWVEDGVARLKEFFS